MSFFSVLVLSAMKKELIQSLPTFLKGRGTFSGFSNLIAGKSTIIVILTVP